MQDCIGRNTRRVAARQSGEIQSATIEWKIYRKAVRADVRSIVVPPVEEPRERVGGIYNSARLELLMLEHHVLDVAKGHARQRANG